MEEKGYERKKKICQELLHICVYFWGLKLNILWSL